MADICGDVRFFRIWRPSVVGGGALPEQVGRCAVALTAVAGRQEGAFLYPSVREANQGISRLLTADMGKRLPGG